MPKLTTLLLFIGLTLSSLATVAETLDLAVEDEWIPYSNPDGTGLANEIVKAAYRAVGTDVHLFPRPYSRMSLEVQQGKWVGGFNTVKEPKTTDLFIWPKESTLVVSAYYYYDIDRPLKAQQATELTNNERVGGLVDYEYGPAFYYNGNPPIFSS